jgi:hypothetical protein
MNDEEPASPEQLETLARLGSQPRQPLTRGTADALLEHYSATERQRACLTRLGLATDGPIRKTEATAAIQQEIAQRRQLPPTAKQEWILRQRGAWREDLTRGDAFDLIGGFIARERPRSDMDC